MSGSAITAWASVLAQAAITGGIAIAIALALHFGLFALLRRFARLSSLPTDEHLVQRLFQPLRWSMVAVAFALVAENQPVLAHAWDKAARFVIPALMGWTAFATVKAFAAAMESRAVLERDEQAARSHRTRIAILSRSAAFVIVFVTVALILLGIPGVRNVGVALMASAGLAGLAVGAAAQPALKSFIAGMQMALTEPIRIDDLVVIDGESGRVEEIRLTYVVIRTPDERRIIVPTLKFLDTSFQNWTRVSGGITGWVALPVKPGTPLAPIRAAFLALLETAPDWDRRKGELQLAEARVGSLDLRLMVSAKDPSALARLRLSLREGMMEWLREAMPEALCVEA